MYLKPSKTSVRPSSIISSQKSATSESVYLPGAPAADNKCHNKLWNCNYRDQDLTFSLSPWCLLRSVGSWRNQILFNQISSWKIPTICSRWPPQLFLSLTIHTKNLSFYTPSSSHRDIIVIITRLMRWSHAELGFKSTPNCINEDLFLRGPYIVLQ